MSKNSIIDHQEQGFVKRKQILSRVAEKIQEAIEAQQERISASGRQGANKLINHKRK